MASRLVKHNIVSFENFIDSDIPRIISEVKNPVRILKNYDGNDYKTKVFFHLGGKNKLEYKYFPPTMTPLQCRLDSVTYQGHCDINVDIEVHHESENQ